MSAVRIVDAPWARATEAAAPWRNPRRSMRSLELYISAGAIMDFMRWRLYFWSFLAAAQGPIHCENKALQAGVKFVLECKTWRRIGLSRFLRSDFGECRGCRIRIRQATVWLRLP